MKKTRRGITNDAHFLELSEMTADDIASAMQQHWRSMKIVPLENVDVAGLSARDFIMVVASTYGSRQLREAIHSLFDAMQSKSRDLSRLRFAAFDLGDGTFETDWNGIDQASQSMTVLGAEQIGVTGRHDATRSEALSDVEVRWPGALIPALAN